jgi:sec-independent protein translocase protein TatA
MLLFLDAVKPGEIILILVIVLLLFGGKKIPELMRGLGQGMKEFKDASKGGDNDNTKQKEDTNNGGQLKQ